MPEAYICFNWSSLQARKTSLNELDFDMQSMSAWLVVQLCWTRARLRQRRLEQWIASWWLVQDNQSRNHKKSATPCQLYWYKQLVHKTSQAESRDETSTTETQTFEKLAERRLRFQSVLRPSLTSRRPHPWSPVTQPHSKQKPNP